MEEPLRPDGRRDPPCRCRPRRCAVQLRTPRLPRDGGVRARHYATCRPQRRATGGGRNRRPGGDERAITPSAHAADTIGGVWADFDLGLLMVGGGVAWAGSPLLDPLQASLDVRLADVVESVRTVPAAADGVGCSWWPTLRWTAGAARKDHRAATSVAFGLLAAVTLDGVPENLAFWGFRWPARRRGLRESSPCSSRSLFRTFPRGWWVRRPPRRCRRRTTAFARRR